MIARRHGKFGPDADPRISLTPLQKKKKIGLSALASSTLELLQPYLRVCRLQGRSFGVGLRGGGELLLHPPQATPTGNSAAVVMVERPMVRVGRRGRRRRRSARRTTAKQTAGQDPHQDPVTDRPHHLGGASKGQEDEQALECVQSHEDVPAEKIIKSQSIYFEYSRRFSFSRTHHTASTSRNAATRPVIQVMPMMRASRM